jgi:hypothetical protein
MGCNPNPQQIYQEIPGVAGGWLLDAALIWLMYIAFEPFIRRR